MQDLYSTYLPQETCPRSCRSYGSRPATRATVDHTDHTDHTDQEYIFSAWQISIMNCSAVVGIDYLASTITAIKLSVRCIINLCIDTLAISSQKSKSQLLDQTRFWAVNALLVARDEVHHSVWCLFDVPHYARLSRLCRGRTRPCSRRLPARGAVFAFFGKNIPSIYSYAYLVDTCQSDMWHTRKRFVKK